MKKIITKLKKVWVNKNEPMQERKVNGEPILLLNDELENLLLGFANKGNVEITIQLVNRDKKRTI